MEEYTTEIYIKNYNFLDEIMESKKTFHRIQVQVIDDNDLQFSIYDENQNRNIDFMVVKFDELPIGVQAFFAKMELLKE